MSSLPANVVLGGDLDSLYRLMSGRLDYPFMPEKEVLYVEGQMLNIPGAIGTYETEYTLPFDVDLISFSVGASKYDPTDHWAVYIVSEKYDDYICKNIYTKDLGEGIQMMAVRRILKGEKIVFSFRNENGSAKKAWINYNFLKDEGAVPVFNDDTPEITVPDITGTENTMKYDICGTTATIADTKYWDTRAIPRALYNQETGKQLSPYFWEGMDEFLTLIGAGHFIDFPITEFHYDLYVAAKSDSKLSMDFQEYLVWADENGMECLTDKEKASVYVSVQSGHPTYFGAGSEPFLEGNLISYLAPYFRMIPNHVLSFILFKNPAPDTGPGVLAFVGSTHVPELVPFLQILPFLTEVEGMIAEQFDPYDYFKPDADYPLTFDNPDYDQYRLSTEPGPETDYNMAMVTVVHELGHALDFSAEFMPHIGKRLSDMHEWQSISGWDTNGGVIIKTQPGNMTDDGHLAPMTAYGATLCVEDFAESFTAYVFNPNWMKAKYKAKYDFMDKWLREIGYIG